MEEAQALTAEASREKSQLGGYLIGRAVTLAVIIPLVAVAMFRQGGTDDSSVSLFFLFSGLSFGVSLATALFARKYGSRGFITAVQPVWDIAYCTGVVYVSGGVFSPFVFLYLLAIIGGATLFSRKGSLAVASQAAIFNAVLSLLQLKHVIEPLNPFLLPMDATGGIVTRLTFHTVAFYAIALLSGYLAEELRRTTIHLEKARGRILDLTHLQAAILQSMGTGLMAVDEEGRVMFLNHAAEVLLARAGYTPEEHGKIFDLAPGDRHEVQAGPEGRIVLGYSVVPLSDREGGRIGVILTFQDLTSVRKLEEGLIRADKMAAIGRLAAGLAHEIRNPLASLSGSVQILEASVAKEEGEERALFEIVLRETDRLSHLVTDFLGYARPGELRLATFQLKELVDQVGFFLRHGEGREGFALAVEVSETLTITADREQVESLLLNLFRNSIEASPSGVRVSVEAHLAGNMVEMTVADDGPGMSEAMAARAFEPFVSDKPGGTGLGLATVHRIAQSHGGTATFENREGSGVSFRIRLPVSPGARQA